MSAMANLKKVLPNGARIVAANIASAGDKLQGTQHLLLESGRELLTSHFRTALEHQPAALLTSLDTSVRFVDAAGTFEDRSRDNDISWYVVGQEPELQGRGFKHTFPRTLVSNGEKRNICALLAQLAVGCATRARDEVAAAGGFASGAAAPLLGATIEFSADTHCFGDLTADVRLGYLEHQMAALAAEERPPDFFAIRGVSSAAQVDIIGQVLAANAKRVEVGTHTTTTGHTKQDDAPSETGFDIPTLIQLSEPPSAEAFREVLAAAARVPQILGVNAPTPLDDAQHAQAVEQLRDEMPAGSGLLLLTSEEAGGTQLEVRVGRT